MGCDYYKLENRSPVHFSDTDVVCVCSLSEESELDSEDIRSLAYLGAAIALMHQDKLDHGFIPSCIPDKIRKAIDSYFNQLNN